MHRKDPYAYRDMGYTVPPLPAALLSVVGRQSKQTGNSPPASVAMVAFVSTRQSWNEAHLQSVTDHQALARQVLSGKR